MEVDEAESDNSASGSTFNESESSASRVWIDEHCLLPVIGNEKLDYH